jgi:hypothetical protein
MWTFTLGLCAQYSFGVGEDPTEEEIYRILHETGTIVIRDALEKNKL